MAFGDSITDGAGSTPNTNNRCEAGVHQPFGQFVRVAPRVTVDDLISGYQP